MSQSVESSIREYLDSLGKRAAKPRRVVDKEAVAAVRDKIKRAVDPIEKLKLFKELEAARQPKVEAAEDRSSELEEGFVAQAKAWADAQGIPASAFVSMKVPRDVLRRAGFTVSGAARSAARAGGARAPRIDLEEVTKAIGELPKTWSLKELAAKLDRDTATTRNYVKRLVDDHVLTIVGEDNSKQGRPAKIYSLKK
jgi:hypothetical protein